LETFFYNKRLKVKQSTKKPLYIFLTVILLLAGKESLANQKCVSGKIDLWAKATFATTGDTLIINGQSVKLISIRAPSIEKKQKFFQSGQPLSKLSQTQLNKIIANNNLKVGLEFDKNIRNAFGKQQAHAFLEDGRSVQQLLLQSGLVLFAPTDKNDKNIECYRKTEQIARQKNRMLWSLTAKIPQLRYPIAESKSLTTSDIGYRIIRGKVASVSRSKRNIIINLDTTGIRIIKKFWKNFNYRKLQSLKGKVIEIRGYAVQFRRGMYVNITSPYAIDLLP
jgi:micrococcal nuclease